MSYHLRIALSMLGIVCVSALDIDWKTGMSDKEQKQTVTVGTDVVFKWSNFHDVYQLPDKAAYDNCDFSKATKLAGTNVNTYTYKSTSEGIVYFSCSVYSGAHCKANQKLTLTVTGMFSVWANLFWQTTFI